MPKDNLGASENDDYFIRQTHQHWKRKALDLSELGIKLNDEKRKIKDQLIRLREKIAAHPDKEEMEYATWAIKPFAGCAVRKPIEAFQEGLYLDANDYLRLEIILRRLVHPAADKKFYFFSLIRTNSSAKNPNAE